MQQHYLIEQVDHRAYILGHGSYKEMCKGAEAFPTDNISIISSEVIERLYQFKDGYLELNYEHSKYIAQF